MEKYLITQDGKVFNIKKETEISQCKSRKGYLKVNLYIRGKNKLVFVHRLVANKYIPNPENKPQINHKDGNKTNNFYKNLEWCTQKENMHHAMKNGLRADRKGEKNTFSKFTNKQVLNIRKLYNNGEKIKIIARNHNVSYSAIYFIIKKLSWAHI